MRNSAKPNSYVLRLVVERNGLHEINVKKVADLNLLGSSLQQPRGKTAPASIGYYSDDFTCGIQACEAPHFVLVRVRQDQQSLHSG